LIRRFFTGKLRRLILISFAVQAAGLGLFLLSFHQQQKISLETAERNFENGTRVLENEMAWCTDCLDDLTTRMINYLSLRRGSDLDRINAYLDRYGDLLCRLTLEDGSVTQITVCTADNM